MELTTDQKGSIAETAITAQAVRLGIGVLKPLTDGDRYDLVFDLHPQLLRVQCKWGRRSGDVVVVQCNSSRRAPEGFRRRTYSASEIDAIAAYCADVDRCFFFPISMLEGKNAIQVRLSPTRNNQRLGVMWADLFDMRSLDWTDLEQLGAIAQLGERRHGMAEVVGSSPTSSTPRAADENGGLLAS